jgi:hypothetical protein
LFGTQAGSDDSGPSGVYPQQLRQRPCLVFEWDNVSQCTGSFGPDPRPVSMTKCTVYEVFDAMVGGGVELDQMG